MGLVPVKEIAKRWGVTERRVQKLCEEGNIQGASRIGGIWLIPEKAEKPADRRKGRHYDNMRSLKELCAELSISPATGNNWLKTGKLRPTKIIDGKPYFSEKYAVQVLAMVKDSGNSLLKSRRNKKHVSGNGIYKAYIDSESCNVQSVEQVVSLLGEDITDQEAALCLITECALQMLNQVFELGYIWEGSFLEQFLKGNMKIGKYEILIQDLLPEKVRFPIEKEKLKTALQIKYIYEPKEDILGLLYISLKNLGERKASGAYYTPTRVVKRLVDNLKETGGIRGKILDPCCGTGNFYLQLPDEVEVCDIFGKDIDPISVQIARINLVLRYRVTEFKHLYQNIRVEDYLLDEDQQNYDCILGNPPWGYEFTAGEAEQLKQMFPVVSGKNVESYDVFLQQSIRRISRKGKIAFVLPEAVLNVKSHQGIRQAILDSSRIQVIDYLGNAFDKVQCPAIIMQLAKEKFSTKGMKISIGNQAFTISTERKIGTSCFNFHMEDQDYLIFDKIGRTQKACYLKHQADFALGIVTGDNRKYITDKKKKNNEIVLKGANIYKYSMEPADCYIQFVPEHFQQVAPVEYYRAPEKLLYRFISNQLVFAYDNHQTLSLNSCNIVIPHIPGLSVKYILAVLNSRTAQFWFCRKFNSIKVLRNHIEQLPIPKAGEKTQQEIIAYTDRLIACKKKKEKICLYDELDEILARLYQLSDSEYSYICSRVNQQNLFLSP